MLRWEGLWFQARPSKKQDPISKITGAKRAGGVAKVVERLPSKYETLSLNSSIAKKKKNSLTICLSQISAVQVFIDFLSFIICIRLTLCSPFHT
jgi:hypothetical protein